MMYDFLENVKLYVKIQEELGIVNSGVVQISVDRIIKLSEFFSKKVKLMYACNPTVKYKYHYELCIDNVKFLATSDLSVAEGLGLTEEDFKKGAEVWG